MKTTFKYIVAALAFVALSASCDRRVDFPSQEFVTLDNYSYSVDESAGELVIPVHVYNHSNKDVQVAVKLLADSAVEGTDYELVTPTSGVLSFPAGTDSLVIKVAIKPHVGVYTGTKKFGVQVASATEGVVTGEFSTASVSVSDLDHPLADILGDYVATGNTKSSGVAQWKVTFAANEDDVTKVNVVNLSWFNETLVGDVSEDHNVVTLPFGQMYVASGYATMFCGWATGGYYNPSGNLLLTRTETGWAQSTDVDTPDRKWGIGCLATSGGSPLGWLDYIQPGLTLTK